MSSSIDKGTLIEIRVLLKAKQSISITDELMLWSGDLRIKIRSAINSIYWFLVIHQGCVYNHCPCLLARSCLCGDFPIGPVKYTSTKTLLIRNIGNKEAKFTMKCNK